MAERAEQGEFDEAVLGPTAALIWREVVYLGNHLTLHHDTKAVAVVMPFDEYERMVAAATMWEAR